MFGKKKHRKLCDTNSHNLKELEQITEKLPTLHEFMQDGLLPPNLIEREGV